MQDTAYSKAIKQLNTKVAAKLTEREIAGKLQNKNGKCDSILGKHPIVPVSKSYSPKGYELTILRCLFPQIQQFFEVAMHIYNYLLPTRLTISIIKR